MTDEFVGESWKRESVGTAGETTSLLSSTGSASYAASE